MDYDKLYFWLHNYCRWNEPKEVKKQLLEFSEGIDLTNEDGELFHLAIAHDYPEVLRVLVDYYEKNQMQGDPNSLQYKYAKRKLHDIFQEAVKGHGINSDEIREILAKYNVYGDNFTYDFGEVSDSEEREKAIDEELLYHGLIEKEDIIVDSLTASLSEKK
ncbi:MAG: hypothetical protein K0Q51_1036 [Rickettsiaceae bacterium]|jgi:hypothetical protein|nr:hypothetical protein [Rickettsiaceae bacterium]